MAERDTFCAIRRQRWRRLLPPDDRCRRRCASALVCSHTGAAAGRIYVLFVVCVWVCLCVCRYCRRFCSRVCRGARRQRSNVLAALQFVRDTTRAQFVVLFVCSSRLCFTVVFFFHNINYGISLNIFWFSFSFIVWKRFLFLHCYYNDS